MGCKSEGGETVGPNPINTTVGTLYYKVKNNFHEGYCCIRYKLDTPKIESSTFGKQGTSDTNCLDAFGN